MLFLAPFLVDSVHLREPAALKVGNQKPQDLTLFLYHRTRSSVDVVLYDFLFRDSELHVGYTLDFSVVLLMLAHYIALLRSLRFLFSRFFSREKKQ
jgi:hypothetical protein